MISLAVNGGGIKGFSNERYFGRQFDNGDRLRSFACQIAVIGIHAPSGLVQGSPPGSRADRKGRLVGESMPVNTIRPNISRIIPVITEIMMMLFGGVLISVKRLTPSRDSFK